MKHINLLISTVPEVSLDVLASRIFSLVHADNCKERSSVNYVGGRYYVGCAAGMEVKVMLSDDSDHSDLPYWVRLSATDDGHLEETEIEKMIRKSFMPSGLRVARIENFGQINEVRTDYKP